MLFLNQRLKAVLTKVRNSAECSNFIEHNVNLYMITLYEILCNGQINMQPLIHK